MLKKIEPVYYFITIFFLCLLYAFVNGDRLPYGYSQIFDEKHYIDIVVKFPEYLLNQNFTPYYNSRLLMPGLAHYLIRFANISYSLRNINLVFLILNLLSICTSIFFYIKISKFKGYTQNITILGFCLIFANFFILKFAGYYPILMDIFGFTSGIILYYFYIKKKDLAFYVSLFLSMFVFPTTILIVLALLTSSIISFNTTRINTTKNFTLIRYLLIACFIIFLSIFSINNYHDFLHDLTYEKSIQLAKPLIPLTVILVLPFIFILLRPFFQLLNGISINVKGVLSLKFVASLFIMIIFFVLSKYFSNNFHDKNPLNGNQFILNIITQIISFPLKFLISHFIYYGIFIIFFILYFKAFLKELFINTDSFLKFIVFLFIIFSFGTETRQFLQLFPFIAIIFLDSIKSYKFEFKTISIIFLFQLLWSRFWYNINVPEGFLINSFPGSNYFIYPADKYFQFQGPWLSTEKSVMYGLFFLLTFIVAYLVFRNKNSEKLTFSLKNDNQS